MQLFAGLILLVAVIGATTASENARSANPRIVNGINAQATPYNAYILYLNSANAGFFGGGSLISDRHVLTAAQNIQGFARWEVGLGSTVFGQLIVQVSTQAISHPSFNSQNRANDIGIVILPSPVIFSAAIAPIALPQLSPLQNQMPLENEQGKVVGFGFITSSDQGPTAFLKAAYQRVIGDNRCSGTYQIQLPNHFCAEDTTQRGNVCNGDLGAGFTVQDRRIETLAGVASLITASCDSLTPTGYTRVSVYRQWIRDTTGV